MAQRPTPVMIPGPSFNSTGKRTNVGIDLGAILELTGAAEEKRERQRLEELDPTVDLLNRLGALPQGLQGTLAEQEGPFQPGTPDTERFVDIDPQAEALRGQLSGALSQSEQGPEILRNLLKGTLTPGDTAKPDRQIFVKRGAGGNVDDSLNVDLNDPNAVSNARREGFRPQTKGTAGVTVNVGGESHEDFASQLERTRAIEQAKIEGKRGGNAFSDIQDMGRKNKTSLTSANRALRLAQKLQTGKLAPLKKTAAEIGQALGINIDPNLDDLQAFEALVNETTLQLRNTSEGAGMPGQMSDRDVKFLQAANFGLDKTSAANVMIITARMKILERGERIAKLAQEYKKGNQGIFDTGEFNDFLDARGLGGGGESVFNIPPDAVETGKLTEGIEGVPDGLPIYQLPDGTGFIPTMED